MCSTVQGLGRVQRLVHLPYILTPMIHLQKNDVNRDSHIASSPISQVLSLREYVA